MAGLVSRQHIKMLVQGTSLLLGSNQGHTYCTCVVMHTHNPYKRLMSHNLIIVEIQDKRVFDICTNAKAVPDAVTAVA